MFDYLFDPKIEEKGDFYIIRGVPFYLVSMDFQNAYGTSYITKAMLSKINSYSFRIHKFFMVEFHYTLLKIIHNKRLRTPLDKLIKLQYLIENETWLKGTENIKVIDRFDKIKDLFKFKAFDMQEQFLRSYGTITNAYLLKGLLLDAKAGSGKSLCALMWSKLTAADITIILCPDSIVHGVWELEFKKHFKKAPIFWTTVDGTDINKNAEYLVVHYSALTSSQGEKLNKYLAELKKANKSVNLVIDECHNFNDETSKRSQTVTEWADQGYITNSLPMSGTPLKALGRECYTVFTLIDKLFTPIARKKFLNLYGRSRENLNELLAHRIGRGKFTIPTIDGMGETPPVTPLKIEIPNAQRFTLNNVRSEMMLYIEERVKFYYQHMDNYNVFFWDCVNSYKEAVESNIKEATAVDRYISIVKRFKLKGFKSFDFRDIEDNKFCKALEEDIMNFLPKERAKQFKNIRSAVKYLNLKIRGEALGNVLGKMREEAATALIEYSGLPTLIRSAKKKTLLFTSYVESLLFAQDYFIRQGFKPITVYGGTNDARDDNLKDMAVNPSINPGIATFKSLKEGYPCIFANQIIFLNAPYRDYELTQTLARVWRKGQDTECFFWMLDLDTGDELNIQSRSIDIMKWSAEQVDQLISQAAGYGGKLDLRGVMGAEVYKAPWIMEEESTDSFYFTQNVLDLF